MNMKLGDFMGYSWRHKGIYNFNIPPQSELDDISILGDGHQSVHRDFYNNCKDVHCGIDDHKPHMYTIL